MLRITLYHKNAAYYSTIHRLINIPMDLISYNNELQIVKQIALNKGDEPTLEKYHKNYSLYT